MSLRKYFLLVFLLLVCYIAKTQSPNYYVQFRVITITDAETADQINQKLGSKTGFIESHADYITSTYFCLISLDSNYTEEDFVNWFAKLGFEITCYTRGIQNRDVMVSPHILKTCVEQKL